MKYKNIDKILIKIPALGLFLWSLFVPITAFGWGSDTTHPALSDEIVDFYNLSFSEKRISGEEKEWIKEGSILEDAPPRWINHLYDPIHNIGWDGKKLGHVEPWLVNMLTRLAFTPERKLSAKEWVNNELMQESYASYEGNRTWGQALRYYADGNLKEAYRTLGFVLHLLEDVGVPEHTRNDPHPHSLEHLTGETGSPFEEYAKKWTPETLTNAAFELSQAGAAPTIKNTIEEYIDEVAFYSNKYFFSKDTINDPDFEHPKILREDGFLGYGLDENKTEIPLVRIKQNWNSTINDFELFYELTRDPDNDPIFDAYFDRLSKKIVINGAGVMDLFHKKAEEAVINKEFPNHIVQINTKPFTPKVFSFVGESFKIYSKTKSIVATVLENANNAINFISDKIVDIFSNDNPSSLAAPSHTHTESSGISLSGVSRANASPNLAYIKNQLDDISDAVGDIEIILNPPKISSKIAVSSQTIPTPIPVASQINSIAVNIGSATSQYSTNSQTNSTPSSNNSSASSNPTPTSTPSSNVSRVLISEIQVGGVDAGDEFIEIYNPDDVLVDISGWSIQYISGSASTISSSTVSRKNFTSGNLLQAKSFFLIARGLNGSGADGYRGGVLPDLTHRSFSLSGAATGAKVFLVRDQNDIEGLNDPDIVDFIDYAFEVPKAGESLERLAYVNTQCATPSGSDEFSGNGCDMGSNLDFSVRNISKPQNSANLPEPRTAPQVQNVSAIYEREYAKVNILWEIGSSSPATGIPYTYAIKDVSNPSSIITLGTSSVPQFSTSIKEIGRTYSFDVAATDKEGMSGFPLRETITIPSFISRSEWYVDPVATSSYLLDVFYDQYPFVPDIYQSPTSTTYKALVVYLNSDPDSQDFLENGNSWQSTSSKALMISFDQCSGGASLGTTLLLPDQSILCGVAGGLSNSALSWNKLEDNHIRILLASSTNDTGFSSGDYLTFAFYSFYQSGGGVQTLKLVATDKTKYYFSPTTPTSNSPSVPTDLKVDFNTTNSKIILSWLPSTDVDSLDSLLTHELSVNSGAFQVLALEVGSDPLRRYASISATPNSDYVIEIRAVDERDNVSAAASISYRTPAQIAPFGISNIRWGNIASSSTQELSFNFPSDPFISNGGYPWYGMIFYVNQDPPLNHSFNLEEANSVIVGSSSVLNLQYPTCGTSMKQTIGLFISDSSLNPGLCFRRETISRATPYYILNSDGTGTIAIELQSNTFTSSDYITIGFYNTDSFGFPTGTFNLVGRDLNRYYFDPALEND